MTPLLTVVAGGLGAALRLVVDGAIRARRPGVGAWVTCVINVSGSLVLGLLAGLLAAHALAGSWETVLGTGVCGGYTTFSTASVETVRMAEQRRYGAALAYASVSLVASLGACAAGFALATHAAG